MENITGNPVRKEFVEGAIDTQTSFIEDGNFTPCVQISKA